MTIHIIDEYGGEPVTDLGFYWVLLHPEMDLDKADRCEVCDEPARFKTLGFGHYVCSAECADLRWLGLRY